MSAVRATAPAPARTPAWVRAIPMLAAVVVGAASFTLSFFAQSEVSADLGAVPQRLSWLVPIIIDGGVLAGSASIWSSATRSSRKDPVAYLTIVSLLVLSVVINVHHAGHGGGVLAQIIAGAPPVVLLLCLELVAAQARRDAVVAFSEVTVTAPEEVPAPAAAVTSTPALARRPATPVVPEGRHFAAPAPTITAAATPVAAAAPALPVTSNADLLAAPLTAPLPQSAPEPTPAPRSAALTEPVEPRPAAAPPAPAAAALSAPTRAERPNLTVVPPAPQDSTSDAETSDGRSQADQVRAMFAQHVETGGDPMDSSLARKISESLDAPLPSVRRVLATTRRAAAERAAAEA